MQILRNFRHRAHGSVPRSDYHAWFANAFNVRAPVAEWGIWTSWPEAQKWGNRARTALLEIECDYIREELLPGIDASGAFVEFGVWQGWWIDKLYMLSESVGLSPEIYGFDSFEGLPEPSKQADSPIYQKGQYAAGLAEVERRLRVSERPRIHLVPGWFKDSLRSPQAVKIERVSYARIDSDLYSSAVECLAYLSSRLCDGAILVFDDWGTDTQNGETKAFAEWLPTVPHLRFEFLFYSQWHLYLRVHRS